MNIQTFLSHLKYIFENKEENEVSFMPSKTVELNVSDFGYIGANITKKINKLFPRVARYEMCIDDLNTIIDVGTKQNPTQLLRMVIGIIRFFNHLTKGSSNLVGGLHLILITLDEQKKITYESGLSIDNINSGCCIRYPDKAKVIVYRSQEIIKVVFHELIHAFDIDYKRRIDPEVFKNFFNVDGHCKPIAINECFTDTFAIILNSCLYSILFKKDLKTILSKENKFIRNQAKKILAFYGYKQQNCKLVTEKHMKICEQTHAISYYVLKAYVFNNIDAFIDSLNSFETFSKILEDSFKDCSFVRYLRIKKGQKAVNTDLRMSCHDVYHRILSHSILSHTKI